MIDGIPYTIIDVSSNGWLNFGGAATNANQANSTLPTASFPGPFVAAYWDDLINVSVYAGVLGTSPNRVYAIEWQAERYQSSGVAVPDSFIAFQVKLHETSNVIDVTYRDVETASRGDSATIGFQTAGAGSAKAYPLSMNVNVLRNDTGGSQGWSVSPVR